MLRMVWRMVMESIEAWLIEDYFGVIGVVLV
jgi:hypothetical protein